MKTAGKCFERQFRVAIVLTVLSMITVAPSIAHAASCADSPAFSLNLAQSGFRVADVTSPFCGAGRHAYFLHGVSYNVTFTASVNLAGKTLKEVHFSIPGRTDVGTAISRAYNVGTEFGVGGKLRVKAVATDGTQTPWRTVAFDVVNPPPGIPAWSLIPMHWSGGNLRYSTGSLKVNFLGDGLNLGNLPDFLPGFGGAPLQLDGSADMGVEVLSNGTATLKQPFSVSADLGKIAGYDFSPSTGAELVWNYDASSRKWIPGGYFLFGFNIGSITPPHYFFIPVGPIAIPAYWRGGFEAGFDSRFGLIGWTTHPVITGDAQLKVLGKFILGVGVADALAVEGEIKGGPVVDMQFPEKPNFSAHVYLAGTARIVVWIWSWSPGTLEYRWPEQGTAGIQSLDGELPDASGFKLLSRDYLNATMSMMSTQGLGNIIEANVFPHSAPALTAMTDGRIACAWLCDVPARGAADRTAVRFSTWDGTEWSEHVLIDDDGTADFAPQIASLANGNIIAAWQNATEIFGEDVSVEDALPTCEISVAMFDTTTGTWGDAVTLTDNDYLDRTPRLTAFGNNALLTWVSNATSHYLGTDEEPNDIRFATYDGNAWSAPATATEGLPSVIKTSLAYDGETGVLIYSADTDADFSTEEDRELFLLTYSDNTWAGPTRLTNDDVKDENPQVVSTDVGFLVAWYRDGNIVYSRGLDLSTFSVAAETGVSSGAADFRLAVGIGGRISLVWQDISDELVDLWAAVYDPNLDQWSQPYQLTSDGALERAPAVAYDQAGDLMVVYTSTAIDAETLEFGLTDLCYLHHEFGVDLAVFADDVIFSDTPAPGEEVEITAVIRNLGGVAAENVDVAFFSDAPGEGGTFIGQVTTSPSTIIGGGSATATVTWSVPTSGEPQTIYVLADPDLEQNDGNRDNNMCSITATLPDLVISNMDARWVGEYLCNVTVAVTNQGTASCSDIGVAVRLDDTGGEMIYEYVITSLPVGSSYETTFLWDLTEFPPTAQQITLYAIADEAEAITEISTLNNTGTFGVIVPAWSLEGDVTLDCEVGIQDLIFVRNRLGQSLDASPENFRADVNEDLVIDILDLVYVRNRMGASCGGED